MEIDASWPVVGGMDSGRDCNDLFLESDLEATGRVDMSDVAQRITIPSDRMQPDFAVRWRRNG